MEKTVKIAFSASDIDYATVSHKDHVIKVKKWLSPAEMVVLTKSYIEEYLTIDSNNSQIISAELNLSLRVMDLCTNLEYSEKDINIILETGLISEILSKVENYKSLRTSIKETIVRINNQLSLETKISNFIDLGSGLLDRLSKVENLSEMAENFSSAISGMGNLSEQATPVVKTPKKKGKNAK